MSKFKVGDRVVAVKDYDVIAPLFKKGASGVVCRIYHTGVPRVMFDKGDFQVRGMSGSDGWGADDEYFELETKSKPPKLYTETDRRKAAKEVRIAQDKLKKLVDKARDTGIKIHFTNQCVDMIDIVMEYQPATPKKRVY